MTNTLAIAALFALSNVPHQPPSLFKNTMHIPCNTERDYQLIVDMHDYRLNDENISYTSSVGEKEAFYTFPNGGIIHLFVKEG